MKKLPESKNAKALAKELFYLLLPYKNFVHSIISDNGTDLKIQKICSFHSLTVAKIIKQKLHLIVESAKIQKV
jgi:hypothetical protein